MLIPQDETGEKQMQRKVLIPLPGCLRQPHLFRLAGKDGGEKGRWVPFGAGFRALKKIAAFESLQALLLKGGVLPRQCVT